MWAFRAVRLHDYLPLCRYFGHAFFYIKTPCNVADILFDISLDMPEAVDTLSVATMPTHHSVV